MSDIEREEFEQAVADKWSDSYKFTRFGDEDYYDEVLEGMWWGWQASRQALSSCSEIPNSSDPASRQDFEGEAVLWWDENDVWDLDECVKKTPTSRHTIPLYTHPASTDVPSGMSERLDVLAKGLENLQRNSGNDVYQWEIGRAHV